MPAQVPAIDTSLQSSGGGRQASSMEVEPEEEVEGRSKGQELGQLPLGA